MLLRNVYVRTYSIAHLLNSPRVVQLYMSVGRQQRMLLVVLYLQTRAQHTPTLAVTNLVFPPTIIKVPALQRLLRTISILPALAQRDLQILGQFIASRHRSIETMADAPIRWAPVVPSVL